MGKVRGWMSNYLKEWGIIRRQLSRYFDICLMKKVKKRKKTVMKVLHPMMRTCLSSSNHLMTNKSLINNKLMKKLNQFPHRCRKSQ